MASRRTLNFLGKFLKSQGSINKCFNHCSVTAGGLNTPCKIEERRGSMARTAKSILLTQISTLMRHHQWRETNTPPNKLFKSPILIPSKHERRERKCRETFPKCQRSRHISSIHHFAYSLQQSTIMYLVAICTLWQSAYKAHRFISSHTICTVCMGSRSIGDKYPSKRSIIPHVFSSLSCTAMPTFSCTT